MSDLNLHVMRLFSSYHRWTGRELLPETSETALWKAPFVVVSHGIEADPILNYGNEMALALWEMDWKRFTQTPSRLTAEVPNREERQALLERVSQAGFIDDYSGVRISATGKRFRIENATVWNVVGEGGQYLGQAATFSHWRNLQMVSEIK